jgi:ABC-type dipeptide/oligopeptide/nickel transport system permease subunit
MKKERMKMDTRDTESEVVAKDTSHANTGVIAAPDFLDLQGGLPAPSKSTMETPTDKTAKQQLSPFQESLRSFRRDIRAMISVGALLFLVLLPIVGPPIYKHIGGTYTSDFGAPIGPAIYHSYDHQELSGQNQGPSARYWLGTDNLGRDLLARLMQGILISIIVALLVEIVNLVLGVLIGVLAGYYGGWTDTLLARFTDLIFAFPGLLFVILLSGIFGQSASDYFASLPVVGPFLANGNGPLVIVSLALALVSWPLMARYVRGQTLQLKQQQFIEAARSAGTSDARIIVGHIIPNLFSIVFIASTLDIAGTIIGESGLSLLGLGVRPPGSSLGLMIADGADLLEIHPWNALLPTIVLTIIVLAISFIGDGLRDAFDPHTKD